MLYASIKQIFPSVMKRCCVWLVSTRQQHASSSSWVLIRNTPSRPLKGCLEEVKKLTGSNPDPYNQTSGLARKLVDDNILKDADITTEKAIREGLKDIGGHAWWGRTWILQEIAAHENPTLFCRRFRCT
jgi:hypothetical protein